MICCVTGHRPSGFNFPREDHQPLFLDYKVKLTDQVEMLIKLGYDTFITGLAEGVDIDFAKTVMMFQRIYEDITLEVALPVPLKFPKNFEKYHEDCYYILSQCNKQHIVSDHYFKGCMNKRNRFMVDRSDLVLAIWNGKNKGGTWDTIKYARSKGKKILYIMLNELNDFGLGIL